MMWSEALTGFPEESPRQVRSKITVEGNEMTSLVNGAVFACVLLLSSGFGGPGVGGTACPGDISPDRHEKSVMLSLVAVAENSRTIPVFDYAEDIGDGRGITFGMVGFTTGTFDGSIWLHHYTSLDPSNRLAEYIPAMDAIDAGPHPGGMSDDVAGLEGFMEDFRAPLDDAFFKQSQIDVMDGMYWTPALDLARSLGVRHNVTLAQLFDACIQMGQDGMAGIAERTSAALGGSPREGVDEILWLSCFLDEREAVLSRNTAWKESIDRIDMFRRLLQTGNHSLEAPFDVTCYGDSFTVTGTGVLP
ncbi:MAG: hypothetical protein AVO35_13015 [Candidatus Aegiribacteria sp. MLS_C]|nr:MAG: hypothetical protein AVO35_13015 [Candidatus Aegiribacteria sp. MLS_C]